MRCPGNDRCFKDSSKTQHSTLFSPPNKRFPIILGKINQFMKSNLPPLGKKWKGREFLNWPTDYHRQRPEEALPALTSRIRRPRAAFSSMLHGNATFNNVTFNFAPPPPKKRKVSRERLQLKKTRERLLQSRTAEGEFSTAERTTVELSGPTSWSTKKSCF